MKNTLNVGRISEGFIMDHIEAGKIMDIYKYLHLDQLNCLRSSKMPRQMNGKKRHHEDRVSDGFYGP